MALRFDLSKVVNGHEVFIGLAFIFFSTGLSFKISKKSLEYCKTSINTKNYGHLSLLYQVYNGHHLCEGSWDKVKDYDEKLIDQSCKRGFIQHATGIIWTIATTKIEQGRFNEVKVLINRLYQIWEDFENMSAKIAQDTAGAQLVLKSRHFIESLTRMDEAIDFAASNGFLTHQIFMLSLKARIQIFMKDIEGARETILQADNLFKSQKYLLNWYVADYLMAHFEFNIQRLEQEILTNDRKAFLKYRKQAYKSGIAAQKIFMRKYAVGRVEYFKLTGHFYWIIGKQKNALEWWHKSIEEGKRIGARVDLSRTYMELGRRLLEPKSKHKEFNGLKAEDYLEKAKTMFQEMDLLWDMDELAKLN